jgi:3-hydroxyacyl-[acyl-carrier-protein] dehydratase
MLLNELYTLASISTSAAMDIISAQVVLDSSHPIFRGHFPGNPILPGVCTVQIIKEILEKATGRNLMLNKAGSIKYQGFINPAVTPELRFDLNVKELEPERVSCSATVSAGGNALCSFKGEYVSVNA